MQHVTSSTQTVVSSRPDDSTLDATQASNVLSREFRSARYRTADSSLYFYTKRCMDIFFIFCSLIWFIPFFTVIAILIKLDSPGPVFFVQNRVGARRKVKNGKVAWEVQEFPMYKFRSMQHNADQTLHKERVKAFATASPGSQSAGASKIAYDPRITRFGHILRRSSIDELPQIINVLRGDMSLVGPRPVPKYEVAFYKEAHFERLSVLPGMTGLWQVKGRGDTSFDEMINLDLSYVQNCSIWHDLKILIMTIPAALMGRGAV